MTKQYKITRPADAPGNAVLILKLHGGAFRMERGTSIKRPFSVEREAPVLDQLERDGYLVEPVEALALDQAEQGPDGQPLPTLAALTEEQRAVIEDTAATIAPAPPGVESVAVDSGEPVPDRGAIETPAAHLPPTRRSRRTE